MVKSGKSFVKIGSPFLFILPKFPPYSDLSAYLFLPHAPIPHPHFPHLLGPCVYSGPKSIDIDTHIYTCAIMKTWKQCALSVITTMVLWQLMRLGTWCKVFMIAYILFWSCFCKTLVYVKCVICQSAWVTTKPFNHCFQWLYIYIYIYIYIIYRERYVDTDI